MIPLIKNMALAFGGADHIQPLWWCLSLGACLGGNGTLIGASANLTVAGIGDRNEVPFSFITYTLYAFPMMIVSVAICCMCTCGGAISEPIIRICVMPRLSLLLLLALFLVSAFFALNSIGDLPEKSRATPTHFHANGVTDAWTNRDHYRLFMLSVGRLIIVNYFGGRRTSPALNWPAALL